MTNTIKSLSGTTATSVGTSRTSQQSAREAAIAAEVTATPDGPDEVSLTGRASQLASLGEKLSALPVIDSALVERVSHALATGTYNISADRIAGGLLQSEHALTQIDTRR